MRIIQADLKPPLGKPGGTKAVIQRAQKSLSDPKMLGEIARKVRAGKKLDESEEYAIYNRTLREQGPGNGVHTMNLYRHAQYRMDLRCITVKQVREVLGEWTEDLIYWSEVRPRQFRDTMEALQNGEAIRYEHDNIRVVFKSPKRGYVDVITTYRKGNAPGCDTVENRSNVRTLRRYAAVLAEDRHVFVPRRVYGSQEIGTLVDRAEVEEVMDMWAESQEPDLLGPFQPYEQYNTVWP